MRTGDWHRHPPNLWRGGHLGGRQRFARVGSPRHDADWPRRPGQGLFANGRSSGYAPRLKSCLTELGFRPPLLINPFFLDQLYVRIQWNGVVRVTSSACGALSLVRTLWRLNFVFNVMGMIVPIAITLVTVPIYISYIGVARYGVLSIIWILLGYFGFLDFGLSRATANALAKLAHASKEDRTGVFLTSLYLNLVLGALGGIVLYYAGGALLHHWLPLSEAMGAEVETAFPWIACMLPLALLAGVARGAIESRERFFVINVLDLVGVSLGQILPIFCAIVIGPSLAVVIPAAFLARVLSVGLNLGCVARFERLDTLRVFDRSRFKELLQFGAWVSVSNVISPLLTSIDQLLVGSTLGAVAVAHYAVPMNVVGRSQIIATALSEGAIPPLFAAGTCGGDVSCGKSRSVTWL